MKIDVITRHGVANYGSLLQTYATQSILEKLGMDVEIINYIQKAEMPLNITKTLCNNTEKWSKNFILRMIYYIIQTPNYLISNYIFYKYRKKLLKMTKLYTSNEELVEDAPTADIYCTGSDQVWGPIGNQEFDLSYFLNFVPKNKKKISFSASIGRNENNEKNLRTVIKYLSKYDYITVREADTCTYLVNHGIKNVSTLYDPTLMLNRKEWEDFASNENKFGEYILVYQLHHDPDFVNYVNKISKNKNIKVIRICPTILNCFRGGKSIFLPSPQKFLGLIKNARCVITDSFHGTIFSLIFNVDFLNIIPDLTGMRLKNLLKHFKLEDRIIKSNNDMETYDKKIDFSKINCLILNEQKENIEFLKRIIYGKENK